ASAQASAAQNHEGPSGKHEGHEEQQPSERVTVARGSRIGGFGGTVQIATEERKNGANGGSLIATDMGWARAARGQGSSRTPITSTLEDRARVCDTRLT